MNLGRILELKEKIERDGDTQSGPSTVDVNELISLYEDEIAQLNDRISILKTNMNLAYGRFDE